MISSRWPRPIGIIASIALMPVCTGVSTGWRTIDARGDPLDRAASWSVSIGPLPSMRLAERVDHAADQRVADRHLDDAAGAS